MKNIFQFSIIAVIVALIVSFSNNAYAQKSGNPEVITTIQQAQTVITNMIGQGSSDLTDAIGEHSSDLTDEIGQHDTDIKGAIAQHDTDTKAYIENHRGLMHEDHAIMNDTDADHEADHITMIRKLDEINRTCRDGWSKQLTTERFELVLPTTANPNGEAVLDHETCLVWDRSPNTNEHTDLRWTDALAECYAKKRGGRRGWRAPTIEELASLVDDAQAAPKIPAELKTLTSNVDMTNPFFWTSTTHAHDKSWAWVVAFNRADDSVVGMVAGTPKSNTGHVWCVRGGQGHDTH